MWKAQRGEQTMEKSYSKRIYIIGGIMLTVAGVCFIPKLQRKLANSIYRYQMKK